MTAHPAPTTMTLLDSYLAIRKKSEDLCAPLQKEDYIPQPAAFVSPPKWHLAHTTWFFETFVLKTNLPKYQIYHPDFSFLFNSYYNAVGQRVLREDRGNITRPGVDDIFRYRAYVDEHMQVLMASSGEEALTNLIILGLQHEQQHQELLITDLKYILSRNPTFPVYDPDFSLVDHHNPSQGLLTLEEGVYEIGFEGDGFHFDNEKGRHKQYIQRAEVHQTLVTNAAYEAFISDGGYKTSSLWLDEGWTWVNANRVDAPMYWHQFDGAWHQYTLSGLQPIGQDEILTHVNFYEAAAFAEWSGHRLLTEFEWEVASAHLEWGQRWEWTHSAYLPYPGFKTAVGALGEYNGKFMINQMVLRGASAATAAGHSRSTYRNFFHPHLGWQCTGIRLANR